MKTLGNLKPSKGSNVKKKRVGRGVGSGLGKTAGRGHKGQKARKSSDVPAGFEGGQMPLYRRLPKRGFTNIFRTDYEVVNLDSLSRFASGSTIGSKELSDAGLISSPKAKVKLLGKGKLEAKLTVTVEKASKSAVEAFAKNGGQLNIVEPPKPAKKKIVKKYKVD